MGVGLGVREDVVQHLQVVGLHGPLLGSLNNLSDPWRVVLTVMGMATVVAAGTGGMVGDGVPPVGW